MVLHGSASPHIVISSRLSARVPGAARLSRFAVAAKNRDQRVDAEQQIRQVPTESASTLAAAAARPGVDLRRFYVFQIVNEFNFVSAIWIVFLQSRGFTLSQIGLAESFFHLAPVTLELPSGSIADILGRKNARIDAAFASGEAAETVRRNRELMDLRLASRNYPDLAPYTTRGSWDETGFRSWVKDQRFSALEIEAAVRCLEHIAAG